MNQRQILRQLEQFGFAPAQAKLYLAGLILGKALMKTLAQKARVKRTTAYYLMEELSRRGFFQTRKLGKRKYYFAATPHRLLAVTKERERLIKKLMPEFLKISKNNAI